MSLKRNVAQMAKQRLPAKTDSHHSAAQMSGLRPRPQFEQIVDYLANGQDKVNFPDRQAKLIRNHPFMTQLDFFEMQDDQKKAWEDQKKKQELQDIAEQKQTTQGLEEATQPPSGKGGGGSSASSSGPAPAGKGKGGKPAAAEPPPQIANRPERNSGPLVVDQFSDETEWMQRNRRDMLDRLAIENAITISAREGRPSAPWFDMITDGSREEFRDIEEGSTTSFRSALGLGAGAASSVLGALGSAGSIAVRGTGSALRRSASVGGRVIGASASLGVDAVNYGVDRFGENIRLTADVVGGASRVVGGFHELLRQAHSRRMTEAARQESEYLRLGQDNDSSQYTVAIRHSEQERQRMHQELLADFHAAHERQRREEAAYAHAEAQRQQQFMQESAVTPFVRGNLAIERFGYRPSGTGSLLGPPRSASPGRRAPRTPVLGPPRLATRGFFDSSDDHL